MAADIQKIESAARMAMGSFDAPVVPAPIKARSLTPMLYLLAALAAVALATVVLS